MRQEDIRIVSHFPDLSGITGADRWGDVFDPSTGRVQAHVAFADADTLNRAVSVAADAQPQWAATNPQRRARVLFRFKELVERHMGEITGLISSEHGKVISDSEGEVRRGLEVIEFCCGIPHLLKGEYSQGAGAGIDVFAMRQPVGVAAGITPFNFPAMIPMWMMGPAIACGNAFILKPSERVPSTAVRLAELMIEAGLPEGVFQVIHGDREIVEAITDHPGIAAVSFVGSSDIAKTVYERASMAGKRVQAMGGAKNHGVVMPDADLDQVVSDVIGAAYGAAGERCMAMPVVVPVGEEVANRLREKLVTAIGALTVGSATDEGADFGPVVTAQHKARIEGYIQLAIDEGAEPVIDGRNARMQGYENGFFLRPTFLDRVTTEMRSYREEIFGPVLQMVRAGSFEDALHLVSKHPYGNGASIFTSDGCVAREFAMRAQAGMIGINIPIPAPVAYYTFGGWKRSAFGDLNQHGMDGIRFYTKAKTVTQRWPSGAMANTGFIMPTME